jgi:hypothetical protein
MRTTLCAKFPDHQGKYGEFSSFGASRSHLTAEKALSSLGFLTKFPTQRNRELFWRNREFSRRNRELDSKTREIRSQCRVCRRDPQTALKIIALHDGHCCLHRVERHTNCRGLVHHLFYQHTGFSFSTLALRVCERTNLLRTRVAKLRATLTELRAVQSGQTQWKRTLDKTWLSHATWSRCHSPCGHS